MCLGDPCGHKENARVGSPGVSAFRGTPKGARCRGHSDRGRSYVLSDGGERCILRGDRGLVFFGQVVLWVAGVFAVAASRFVFAAWRCFEAVIWIIPIITKREEIQNTLS